MERLGADGVLVGLRWAAVALACALTATFYLPYPPGVHEVAWGLDAAYAASVLALTAWWLHVRHATHAAGRRHRALALAGLLADGAFVLGLAWVYAFDPATAIFAAAYVVLIEAACRFGLRGSLAAVAVFAVGYAARDVWAVDRYGVELLWSSIAFRVGVGVLIAVVAGTMAERARAEHARLEQALESERAAADALRSLDELRSTFLSAVSHELRTPLTSIMGFSITLRDRSAALSDPDRQMLDHVVAQGSRLERLLEDLLEIERLGRGVVSLRRERADVAALVRGVVQAHAERSGRRFAFAAPPTLGDVDPARFERVVDNLVANAIRYSPDTSEVRVRVARESGGVLVCIDDDGPGVPDELRTTIFEPFERGTLTSPDQPGTGTGLSLVDRIARLHGGRAWVEDAETPESDDGPRATAGASFRVWVPDLLAS